MCRYYKTFAYNLSASVPLWNDLSMSEVGDDISKVVFWANDIVYDSQNDIVYLSNEIHIACPPTVKALFYLKTALVLCYDDMTKFAAIKYPNGGDFAQFFQERTQTEKGWLVIDGNASTVHHPSSAALGLTFEVSGSLARYHTEIERLLENIDKVEYYDNEVEFFLALGCNDAKTAGWIDGQYVEGDEYVFRTQEPVYLTLSEISERLGYQVAIKND